MGEKTSQSLPSVLFLFRENTNKGKWAGLGGPVTGGREFVPIYLWELHREFLGIWSRLLVSPPLKLKEEEKTNVCLSITTLVLQRSRDYVKCLMYVILFNFIVIKTEKLRLRNIQQLSKATHKICIFPKWVKGKLTMY